MIWSKVFECCAVYVYVIQVYVAQESYMYGIQHSALNTVMSCYKLYCKNEFLYVQEIETYKKKKTKQNTLILSNSTWEL